MKRILIVEDEDLQAKQLARELMKENLASTRARTFGEFRERVSQEHFDCIIVDLNMGDGGPDEVINFIPEVNDPVVVYTANTDPELVGAVRRTGASYVEKEGGIELLIIEIFAQISYRSADGESQRGLQKAQRQLRTARPLFASKGALVSLMIGLITTTGGFASWAFHTLSGEVVKAEETKHKFQVIESRVEALEKMTVKFDGLIDVIKEQNRTSIDDRATLRENQKEMKLDIQNRLVRIEQKLDSLK